MTAISEPGVDGCAGLQVSGGAGGTAARLAELESVAEQLIGLGHRLQGWSALLAGVQVLVLRSVAIEPVTGARAELALARCLAGPGGLAGPGLRLITLGTCVRAAVAGYRAADQFAEQALDQVGARALGSWVDPVTLAGAWSTATGLLRGGSATAVRVQGSGWRPSAAPSGPADLAGQVAQLSQAQARVQARGRAGAAAQIRIQQILGPAGPSWVVSVVGTQSWAPVPGAEPFDLSSDAALMAGRPSAARQAVVEAMAAAGIRPGQPILIAGHSQGGMVAASIAADPRLRSRFRVTHVLTLGSPISRMTVPGQVQVLAVQRPGDPVPGLDLRADPDRPNWVQVTGRAWLPALWIPEHEVQRYRDTAAQVQACPDPSVLAWRRSAARFWSGAAVTAQDFSASRVG